MTDGDPQLWFPICPEHHIGGPIGYVRRNGLAWRCPLIARRKVPFKHREPWLAEAFEAEQRAIDDLNE